MTALTLREVAHAVGGECSGGDEALNVTSVVTDSRRISPGCLFVALKGERFDGHAFLASAYAQGAVAALVSQRDDECPLPQIICADTRLGLGLLACAWRKRWQGPVVAITGNSGKTTVKEMTAALLKAYGTVHATQGNLNNDIGAPLTLLGLCASHRAAVVELGANHLGEIAWTAPLVKPQVAVITNVTGAHVGEFGGMGQIAQAKSEILHALPSHGTAVLNRDDRYFHFWQQCAAPRQVVSFGLHPEAQVSAKALSCDAQGRYAFTLIKNGQALGRVTLSLVGQHNVLNALAAAAAALSIGVPSDEVVARLSTLTALPGRLQVVSHRQGGALLDDSYNANPGAVKAALEALMRFPGPRWCALGAMGELGTESDALHAEVGAHAARLGVDQLLTLGEAAKPASEAFGQGHHFADYAALEAFLMQALPPNASLLVKGSRSAGMERLVEALRIDDSYLETSC
ncbi:UDP-N-acetylmuramoyl-tripeptide--D-alanyl-D-alanine ligase [Halomonas alkaliantarctica]|nr:UDP-N-acetylmuramoyl-tripeptide--D-alanyl-D-alanine ligase [Halomonas alkaliantarctica]